MINKFDKKALSWDQDQNRVNLANAVANSIRKLFHLSSDTRALDFGCGTGLVSLALCSQLKQITLADNSSGMLEVLKNKIAVTEIHNLRTIKYDFELDPLLDERFNLIFSSMALHHIENISRLLGVFFNLLEPGGIIALADLDQEDGSFHDSDFTGHKGFQRNNLEEITKQSGFGNVIFKDIYTFIRPNSLGQKEFPVFLMIAKKN